MLPEAVKRSVEECVLCWLATSDTRGRPNVSPKQIFTTFNGDSIVIANIASPGSARNIKLNPQACVSFVDVFRQKGFRVAGAAAVLRAGDAEFGEVEPLLLELTGGLFPFRSALRVLAEDIGEIVAPRYRLFPETTERGQIQDALKTYGVRSLHPDAP